MRQNEKLRGEVEKKLAQKKVKLRQMRKSVKKLKSRGK